MQKNIRGRANKIMIYKFEIPKRLIGLNEEWKDIKSYEGLYQISNLGRVKSLDKKIFQKNKYGKFQIVPYKGQILKVQKQKNGYLIIDLHKNNKIKKKLVHRLVAEAFIPNPNNDLYINHKDNNPQNNKVDNLEWCTQKYNIKYAYNLGNKKPPHMRSVQQVKDNGEIIATFISMQEAERQTKIKATNISKCCRKIRNKAGGYKWQYTQ